MSNRFKSPVLWGSWISTILLTLKIFGIIQIEDSMIDTITTGILSAISLFGIANNPTDKNKF